MLVAAFAEWVNDRSIICELLRDVGGMLLSELLWGGVNWLKLELELGIGPQRAVTQLHGELGV